MCNCHATSVANTSVCRSPPELDIGQVFWPTPAAPATSAPVLALGKRRREEPQGVGAPIGNPPQKRSRGNRAEGILKATRSADRTRHKHVARNPNKKINHEPKEAVRGAERLAGPNAQGVHHRPLQRQSFQQGWVEQTVDGEIFWVEGSVQDEQEQQQQQEQQEEVVKYFEFPKKFKMGREVLLAATQADRERGSVREIKCRRCPDTMFKTWDDYKRHCDTSKNHPLTIDFCDFCGDFFSRTDSLKRHREYPPAECLSVTSSKADEERRETQRIHDEFVTRLWEFLSTGEEYLKAPFSQIIKEKYPESSKKHTFNRR